MEILPANNFFGESARRYADFIDGLPVALYRTTIEGKIVYCNKRFAEIFHYSSAEELIGKMVVDLYQEKKDRGLLVRSIMQTGRVVDLAIAFQCKEDIQIWCSVTAKAVMDEDGLMIFIDGYLKEISHEIMDKQFNPTLENLPETKSDIVILFDLKGVVLDVNESGIRIFGYKKEDILGHPLYNFIVSKQRDLFLVFLSDILNIGQDEGLMTVIDKSGQEHHLAFHAVLVKSNGKAHHIKGSARDVTRKIVEQKEKSKNERFLGVLEMAGGVAHRLNQPLTVLNNLLNQLMIELSGDEDNFQKVQKMHQQVEKLNEITKKIGNIKKYESMDYVDGVRIVDIDRAS
jgi:PAS domain S-box-containing protein